MIAWVDDFVEQQRTSVTAGDVKWARLEETLSVGAQGADRSRASRGR